MNYKINIAFTGSRSENFSFDWNARLSLAMKVSRQNTKSSAAAEMGSHPSGVPLKKCRLNGDSRLVSVLKLGDSAFTGIFPPQPTDVVPSGPLELVWSETGKLLQLGHSFDPALLYGENYGYRSGLNASMVAHLQAKVTELERWAGLTAGDWVLDIGSNDATTLKSYSTPGIHRVGIDPTGKKFQSHYPPEIRLAPELFSAEAYRKASGGHQARLVTSIAMFYDLEDPVGFARQVREILAPKGIWHLEQSYMPSMLRLNSYDTICHEHLEYYSLGNIEDIMQRADLRILDVVMNSVNGGSFAVTVTPRENRSLPGNPRLVEWLLGQEDRMGFSSGRPFVEFAERVERHRIDLTRLIQALKAEGKKILGYGASTKGNVILQHCGLGPADLPAIAEVNEDKFGRFTPGTGIPIVSEAEARAMEPDYFLLLPWHFKEGILRREAEFRARGGRFIVPFPEIEII